MGGRRAEYMIQSPWVLSRVSTHAEPSMVCSREGNESLGDYDKAHTSAGEAKDPQGG